LTQSVLSKIAAELDGEGGTVAVLHGNADPDALASAFALQSAFPRVTIWTPGGVDRAGKAMAKNLGIETVEGPDAPSGARLVVLDTSGPEQLPDGLDLSGAIVIDHHARNERWDSARIYHCDDGRSSCSEIVYELVTGAGRPLGREAVLALMLGIVTDTGKFKFAGADTLCVFADMMRAHGVQMDEVLGLANLEPDISERISQLRGAQRLKYWKVGQFIIAISHGSAFEASVCKALLALGADVAFVGSQRSEQFRISARARPALVRRGLHLGKLLSGVGSETSNGGGGHPGAAGITGIGDVEAILNIAAENAMEAIRRMDSSGD
jgi:phosphoesterase RecJ-like protein